MSKRVRLIPLQCPRCSTPVAAQPDEVAWVCAQCGQGMLLSDEEGVQRLDVFFSRAIPSGKVGNPFWVARGVVRPQVRQTYQGDSSQEMNAWWAAPRLFYIPAFRLKIEESVALGVKYLLQPVRMEPGSPAPFRPVVVSPEDLVPLAEFMVMNIEAERRDALREFRFEIGLDSPQLWILP